MNKDKFNVYKYYSENSGVDLQDDDGDDINSNKYI
jgi:hypothetical protein